MDYFMRGRTTPHRESTDIREGAALKAESHVAAGSESPPSDVDALGEQFRSGQDAALAEAYQRWSSLIYTLAVRATSDRAAAEDITQQVFVKAWHSHARFNPHLRPLSAWLVGIARHVLADHAAAKVRDQRLAIKLAQHASTRPDRRTDHVVDTVVVSEGLAQVEQPRRDILELVYFAGLTHAQIADQLKLPLGTVKSHVRRGLIQLRDLVKVTDDAS